MAQTLTEIKALLAAHGLHPKHRHGQNFLHDHNHLRRILTAAELRRDEVVLEVGPGTGALTEHLLDAGANVVAVEIDHDLEPILRARVAERFPERFTLVMGDILETKHSINPLALDALRAMWEKLPAGDAANPVRFKLIANLPYNIASPLLINLAIDHPGMTLGVVMIQREVAERLTAKPGGKDYGPLGVMMQALFEVEVVSLLPPSCFWPAPKIDSAVVKFVRRAKPLTSDPAALAAMLHTLFSKRRKQIGSILGRATVLPIGIDANARPETLTVEQLVLLSREVRPNSEGAG